MMIPRNAIQNVTFFKQREQNSVNKEVQEIVDNGEPTGSVRKETIAVSGTISISVQNRHSRILLRVLSCGREKCVENPKSQRQVPVEECLDGPARITSKELAPIHVVKSGTLQFACSTRPKVVVGLRKRTHTHTVRLMNSRLTGPKRMMTEVQ